MASTLDDLKELQRATEEAAQRKAAGHTGEREITYRDALREAITGLPAADQVRILGTNAVECYRLPIG